MAKLLTIGVRYTPNMKTGVDNNGRPIVSPVITFYFNCDNRTANIVAGSGVAKGLRAEGDALIRNVKVDDYKKFIYGKNAFPKIISALEQAGGYVYDTSDLSRLESQVEQTIDNVVTSDLSSKLQIDRGAYIDDTGRTAPTSRRGRRRGGSGCCRGRAICPCRNGNARRASGRVRWRRRRRGCRS